MKAFKILLLLLTISCICCKNNSSKKTENTNSKKSNTIVNTITTENKNELETVALSFHNWYVKNNNYYPNDNSKKETTSFNVIKGKNNKCKVDYTSYFKNLKKLGTISEKFLLKEKERTNECAKYLETIDWNEYSTADAYTYDKYCDYLYYMYWTRSQENTENIEVSKITRDNEIWNVLILIDGRKANVKIEKEAENYMITQIDWVD
jgi:hypothetical protein